MENNWLNFVLLIHSLEVLMVDVVDIVLPLPFLVMIGHFTIFLLRSLFLLIFYLHEWHIYTNHFTLLFWLKLQKSWLRAQVIGIQRQVKVFLCVLIIKKLTLSFPFIFRQAFRRAVVYPVVVCAPLWWAAWGLITDYFLLIEALFLVSLRK